MIKRFIALLAVLTAITIGLAAGATPASAAASDCGAGLACIWSGPNFTGTKWTISYSGSGGDYVCNLLGSAAGQDVSYKVGFGGNRGLAVFNLAPDSCNLNIVGAWAPNTQGTLLNQNGSAYHKVYQYYIYIAP